MRQAEQSHFNFEHFFGLVVDYFNGSNINLKLANHLLEILEAQVQGWLAAPPIKPHYALKVLKCIVNTFLEKNPQNLSLRARLNNLRGIIHKSGYMDIKPNLKQALACFRGAVNEGYSPANENLGDYYFEQAVEDKGLVSQSQNFTMALISYKKAGIKANAKLVKNCYLSAINDAMHLGNLDEVINIILSIQKIHQEQPELTLGSAILLIDQLEDFRKLKMCIDDAQKISAKNLATVSMPITTPEKYVLSAFVAVKQDLLYKESSNPVFDYYHATQLGMLARSIKREARAETEEVKAIIAEASNLFNKIIDCKYPDWMVPIVNFVRGLGKEDRNPAFNRLPLAAEKYFNLAARRGCFLAYSYLANLEDVRAPHNAEQLYLIGALAGDPRCQVTYLQNYLAHNISAELKKHQLNTVIELCEKALVIIEKSINNPHTISVDRQRDNHKYFTELLQENSDRPKVLTKAAWNNFNSVETRQLIDLIHAFELTPKNNYQQCIELLSQIQIKTTELQFTKSSDLIAQFKELSERLVIAIEYIKKQQYHAKLLELSRTSPKQRMKDFVKTFRKGHMSHQYYSEFIDPKHRKPELILAWANSAATKNFFAWLLEYEKNNSTNSIERVIYFSEEEQKNVHVIRIGESISYSSSQENVADGKYLFVYSWDDNLFIGSEHKLNQRPVFLHHSSLLAGQPAQCAGEVYIKDGKIVHINNYSGHYLPGMEVLYKTMSSLKTKGYLADNFTVGLVGVELPPGYNKDTTDLTYDDFRTLYVVTKWQAIMAAKTPKPLTEATTVPLNSTVPNVSQDEPTYSSIENDMLKYINNETTGPLLYKTRKHEILSTKTNVSFWYRKTVNVDGVNLSVSQAVAKDFEGLEEANQSGNWQVFSNK